MSLLIKNGKVFVKVGLIETNIYVEKGKISKLTKEEVESDDVVDASGMTILPGLIDSHVHFRDPGLTHKEDFYTGSRAAAKGGVTTVLDMPNTIPNTTTVKALEEKRILAIKSIVNYGFHFGAAKYNLDEIKKAKNIASVKIYMDLTTGDMKVDDDISMLNILKTSKITTVHAEGENVLKIIEMNKKTKNKLYLCHITTEKELEYIQKNKTEKIFVEVTPHHLFLTIKDYKKLGAFASMKPILKSQKDQDALWGAIDENMVDTIATDHAPHTKEEKENEEPFGVPGVETMLPLLLDAVNKGRISLEKVVELCSENPAKIFGIKNKGLIKEGYDADLVIVDLKLEKQIKIEELATKCGWSSFEGMKLKGWPVMTIVNGNVVFDGNFYDIKAKEVEYNE
ncbi:MAG: amidohydrolase family protein [Nanoarchaeota archaeon]